MERCPNDNKENDTDNTEFPISVVRPKPSKPKYAPTLCSILGCVKQSHGRVHVTDLWGEPGSRCRRHMGGTVCNVPGCSTSSQGIVQQANIFGPPGPRCVRHGGGTYCSIPGCGKTSIGTLKVPDEHGPPGKRCGRHSSRPKKQNLSVQKPIQKPIENLPNIFIKGKVMTKIINNTINIDEEDLVLKAAIGHVLKNYTPTFKEQQPKIASRAPPREAPKKRTVKSSSKEAPPREAPKKRTAKSSSKEEAQAYPIAANVKVDKKTEDAHKEKVITSRIKSIGGIQLQNDTSPKMAKALQPGKVMAPGVLPVASPWRPDPLTTTKKNENVKFG